MKEHPAKRPTRDSDHLDHKAAPHGRRRSRQLALGLLVGLVCLGAALYGVPLRRLGTALAGVTPGLFLVAGLLTWVMNAVKCTKLGLLLAGGGHRVRYRALLSAELISVLVDVALPFRLQELVKALIVGRGEGLPAPLVFGAIAVEKGVDLVFLFAVVLALGAHHPLPHWMVLFCWVGLGALLPAVAVMVFLARRAAAVDRTLARVRWPGFARIRAAAGQMLRGVAAVRPAVVPGVLLISAAEWSLLAAALWAAALSVGVNLSGWQIVGVLVANVIAFAVPTSSVGSVGIYELAGKTVLTTLFGMSDHRALALVIVFHVVQAGFGALGGLGGLALAGLTLTELRGQVEDGGATDR